MLNVDDAAICLDCTTRFNNDKTIMPIKVEFYQVWSHSLSVDCAKICNSENNPRGRPVFYCGRDSISLTIKVFGERETAVKYQKN